MAHNKQYCNYWLPVDLDYSEFDRSRILFGGGGGSNHSLTVTPNEHAQRRILKLIRQRIKQSSPSPQAQIIRFPVGIFFVRDRRSGGAAYIHDEITSSFDYWNKDSGEHFDMLFPGWYYRKKVLTFNSSRFIEYRDEIEHNSEWQYSGETDLLVLHFDYNLETRESCFAYDEVIVLQVEEMIREKRIGSLPILLTLIHNAAKASRGRGENSTVWEMSDRIAFLRGRQSIWNALKKLVFGNFSQAFDNVRPFGVFDLRKRV